MNHKMNHKLYMEFYRLSIKEQDSTNDTFTGTHHKYNPTYLGSMYIPFSNRVCMGASIQCILPVSLLQVKVTLEALILYALSITRRWVL